MAGSWVTPRSISKPAQPAAGPEGTESKGMCPTLGLVIVGCSWSDGLTSRPKHSPSGSIALHPSHSGGRQEELAERCPQQQSLTHRPLPSTSGPCVHVTRVVQFYPAMKLDKASIFRMRLPFFWDTTHFPRLENWSEATPACEEMRAPRWTGMWRCPGA